MTRPQLVHGIAWLDGRFGYNVHARGFFSALSRLVPTTASPLFVLEGPYESDRTILTRTFAGHQILSIALMYGSLAGTALAGAPGPRIIYTVWESTKLPDDWIAPLKACDQVWTPSRWGAAVMARNGIDPARIRVVPEGADPAVFHPDVPPTQVIADRGGFKFLHVGRFEERKGTRDVILAFDREFGPADDVLLVLACDNPHEEGFDMGAALRALDLKRPERLVFVPPVARHDMLASLYTACDAFVAPSRAEGWGLPISEAMACGLPVITTGHSAPLDYIGPEAYRIAHSLVPIAEPFFDAADGDHGLWAEPDMADLQRQLRRVRDDPETARARGRRGGARMRGSFGWDAAARVAAAALKELAVPIR